MNTPWISNYETLILGEDGESPIRNTIERCLEQAKTEGVRLRIEIRTKPQGVPNSRSEHNLVADPDNTTVETIMQVLIERLNESPGETYNGEIRINFMQAGSASNRYASFTRQVDTTAPFDPTRFSAGPRTSRPRVPYTPTERASVPRSSMEGAEGDEGGGLEDDNRYNPSSESELTSLLRGMPSMNQQSNVVTDAQARQWLETTWGLLFRTNAQMIAMFERSTRMMESIALRYGMPETPQRGGIQDIKSSSPAVGEQGGLGLLPMLLNAAAHLANSNDPAEVAAKATEMTQKPPPAGAARMAAIQGAGKLVRNLTHGGQNRRRPPEPEPTDFDDEPEPEPEDDGGGYGRTYDDAPRFSDAARFDLERHEPPAHEGADDPSPPTGGGAPNLTDLPADEMKAIFLEWIRKDPSRKQEVMAMLPELGKEVM